MIFRKSAFILSMFVILLISSCNTRLPDIVRVELEKIEINESKTAVILEYEGIEIVSLEQVRRNYTQEEWDSITTLSLRNTKICIVENIQLPVNIESFLIAEEENVSQNTLKIHLKPSKTLGDVNILGCNIEECVFEGDFPALYGLDFRQSKFLQFPIFKWNANIKQLDFSDAEIIALPQKGKMEDITKLRMYYTGKTLDGIENIPNLEWLVLSSEAEEYNARPEKKWKTSWILALSGSW